MAASTITRDTWTNDTGTAANPNADGTLIQNSVLQNHIYARIDEMFAGAGSYATLTLGGKLAVEGTGVNSFSGSLSGTNTVNVRNTLAGTANAAEFSVGNDATAQATYLRMTATSFTPTGMFVADGAHLECIRAGGLTLAATHASGTIKIYSGGTTERASFGTTGLFTLTGDNQRFAVTASTSTAAAYGQVANGTGTLRIGIDSSSGGSLAAGTDAYSGFFGTTTNHPVYIAANSLAYLKLTGAGLFALNKNGGNSFMTIGMTINMAGNDNEIFTLQDATDVSHAFTTDTQNVTFGTFRKAAITSGGLSIAGYTSDQQALQWNAQYTSGDTTKGGSAKAAVLVTASKLNVNTAGVMGANENIVAFRNNVNTAFILDADGDSHQDVGTAWTNFDDHDDIALLHALSAGVSRPGDPLKAAFADLLERHRDTLTAHRIVTFNDDGHHFINWSRAHMLTIGAVRQLGMEVQRLTRRLALIEGHS